MSDDLIPDEDDNGPEAVWCAHCDKLIGYESEHGCDCSEDGDAREVGDTWHCGTCAKDADWHAWLQATLDSFAAIAAELEWDFDRDTYSGGFNSRSRYYTLTRECDACILGTDDDCTCERLKLRISDHGSAYCSEHVSIAMNPSGDDHSVEYLRKRLTRQTPVEST